jgi:outer membrane protein TolC
MKKLTTGILLILFFLCLPHSFAQTNLVVSWENSIQEASLSNSELLSAKNALESSKYLVKGSRSGFLPQVTATANYNYDSTNNPRYYTAAITATENLFSGFLDTSKINQAKSTKSITEANLEITKAKVSFDLKSAFMGLVFSQKFIKLSEDIIKRREANVKLVQLKYESGRENIGSLNLSKAYLAQSKLDRLQAVNSLEVFQSQLAQVLGRDDYNSIEVSGIIPITTPPYESNRKIDYKNLVAESPVYKKSYFNEEFAKSSILLANSNFYPSLYLSQSVERSKRESFSPNNSWVISAGVTFPLFSGGKDYFSFKSANELYRGSVMTRKNTEDLELTKLKQAYTGYIEAVMKLEVDQAFVVAGSSRQRIAQAQYNNGLISFNDWDIIENDLIIRQKALLQSERDRVLAEATWEQAQGKGVIP